MSAYMGWIILAFIVGFFVGIVTMAKGLGDNAKKKLSKEEIVTLWYLINKIK